ncbi:Uma2 family endonuclease [Streptomyces sp. ME19-01-6]|uniref:Uma2 family endonuclease n=1 Tax=Streptomyces sp. ME19-01-6 TaxID=3028686 RepID=UPI0029BA4891|nr:Uma2 family endonuclease [Streptomyces sp. ME19-01-6]MDX3226657.1 Uma2 family endonuclease [Streptomyces sp. ME19-01-6]
MTALAHEAPTTMEVPEDMLPTELGLDEALWQAWKSLELPEGFRAEIVEGFIEVSPTGRFSHGLTINRLRRAVERHLDETDFAAYHDMNVIHGMKVLIPDVFVAPRDAEEGRTEDGLGFTASTVKLVVEVVSPGHENQQRDRVRKRRAYARAGIPVYVLIDDYDNHGTVTVLTSPSPGEETYAASIRVPYGTEVQIPEGPVKGFAITEDITGPRLT